MAEKTPRIHVVQEYTDGELTNTYNAYTDKSEAEERAKELTEEHHNYTVEYRVETTLLFD